MQGQRDAVFSELISADGILMFSCAVWCLLNSFNIYMSPLSSTWVSFGKRTFKAHPKSQACGARIDFIHAVFDNCSCMQGWTCLWKPDCIGESLAKFISITLLSVNFSKTFLLLLEETGQKTQGL